MSGGGWRLLEVEAEGLKLSVVYRRMRCGGEDCVIAAYAVGGQRRLLITPARPSPLCVRGDRLDAEVLREIMRDAGAPLGYLPSFCRVASALLSDSLSETLERLAGLGLFEASPGA